MKFIPFAVVAAFFLSFTAFAVPAATLIKSIGQPDANESSRITLRADGSDREADDVSGMIVMVIAHTALIQSEAARHIADRGRVFPADTVPAEWEMLRELYLAAMDRASGSRPLSKLGSFVDKFEKTPPTYSELQTVGEILKTAANKFQVRGRVFFTGITNHTATAISPFGFFVGDTVSNPAIPIEGNWVALTQEFLGTGEGAQPVNTAIYRTIIQEKSPLIIYFDNGVGPITRPHSITITGATHKEETHKIAEPPKRSGRVRTFALENGDRFTETEGGAIFLRKNHEIFRLEPTTLSCLEELARNANLTEAETNLVP